ncbi:acetoacetate--CoA ligase [Leptospira ilyithenensis]|uniref:Acetoacetate--CoA ligase n=1 Tax=Leptospira ilyithenensis TaxID=2484901 RepID=A0A4R9LR81_9LEPT|nr:acetoacetate--CoA ligase [Leptospira ilyithenensis]TGN13191.1 acetoacetate--CoA ligase [Leptospira ilyithenensis]
MALSRKLWTASGPETLLTKFRIKIEKEERVSLPDYDSFHHWSISNLESFWSHWAKESGFIFHKEPDHVLKRSEKFWESKWFEGAELNFAENLLEKGKQEDIAILYLGEDGKKETLTYYRLKTEVLKLASYFKTLGVSKGDRVCGLVPNAPVSTIGMLAATSLGAIWSSASPDFGAKGILDRFEQIQPKVLLAVDGYFFKGKKISILDKVGEVSEKLASFTDYKATVLFPFTSSSFLLDGVAKPIRYDDLPEEKNAKLKYESISFQDPVYIMFSSGTTGLPKCIVQGAGVLLNHTKELALHANLHAGEKLFYYTTCGWMMWNWSQSILALGATLCQYDGNPFHPDWKTLWHFAEEEGIHVFGTSAKYLSVMEQDGVEPMNEFSLAKLRTILSTGSPLYPSGFRYVYSKIKKDVQLASISGGTDLNGCFALGNPDLPVFEGEIQSRGLGMDVKVFDEDGKPVEKEKGELVCESPFPSMPLFFWNDKDGSKYQAAYFSRFENIWCHGDFAELTENKGMIIYGRSDATLNPGGVRIGTADIYSVVETFPEVQDSVIIGQEYKEDVRIVLFLKMKEGRNLEEGLKSRLKDAIRSETSPRHVPALILEVKDIPYTVNGKKVEIAVRQTVQGETVKNSNALANPESLLYFKDIPELR